MKTMLQIKCIVNMRDTERKVIKIFHGYCSFTGFLADTFGVSELRKL